MDFFEVLSRRRSCRLYTEKKVPASVIEKALEAALIAPNSSNLQTWDFYWVQSSDKKQKLIEACLDQSSAKTAAELIVAVSSPHKWKQNAKLILSNLSVQGVPEKAKAYYEKLIPFLYGTWFLAPLKFLLFNIVGLFRPMARKPWSLRDRDEVSIKSSALACENFMLAISAQGFDTCPMEGFDECRIKKVLGLNYGQRVVMVISVGQRDEKGIWGPQYRVPSSHAIHKI